MGRQMRRREFITLLGGATAWPLAARAQQGNKVWRIGFLGMVSASSHAPRVEALRAGLRELGYVEGKNLVIEFRWAEGHYDRLPALADELVRLNLDVILTHTLTGAIAVAKATTTIPIVITAAGDIVAAGLVSSLSRSQAYRGDEKRPLRSRQIRGSLRRRTEGSPEEEAIR